MYKVGESHSRPYNHGCLLMCAFSWHRARSHGKASPRFDEDFFAISRDRTSIWMFPDILSQSSVEKAAVQGGTAFFAPL